MGAGCKFYKSVIQNISVICNCFMLGTVHEAVDLITGQLKTLFSIWYVRNSSNLVDTSFILLAGEFAK